MAAAALAAALLIPAAPARATDFGVSQDDVLAALNLDRDAYDAGAPYIPGDLDDDERGFLLSFSVSAVIGVGFAERMQQRFDEDGDLPVHLRAHLAPELQNDPDRAVYVHASDMECLDNGLWSMFIHVESRTNITPDGDRDGDYLGGDFHPCVNDPPPPPDDDDPDNNDSEVFRVAGPDRFATAASLALKATDAAPSVVYVATGRDFPDALAVGATAARNKSPVLLVDPDAIPDATADALAQLAPATIVIVGGPAAVSDAVEAELANHTANVIRVHGLDRYATAVAIARSDALEPDTILLATGASFPDALGAGPAAVAQNGVVLLTRQDSVPPPTADFLEDFRGSTIHILGGTNAVSDAVLQDVRHLVGPNIEIVRIAGEDRYDTNTQLAALTPTGSEPLFVTTGATFPDAVTAGAVAGANASPVLLVRIDDVPPTTADELKRRAPATGIVVGGSLAVSVTVEDDVRRILVPTDDQDQGEDQDG